MMLQTNNINVGKTTPNESNVDLNLRPALGSSTMVQDRVLQSSSCRPQDPVKDGVITRIEIK